MDTVSDPPVITVPDPLADPEAVPYVPTAVAVNDKRVKYTPADMNSKDPEFRKRACTAMRQRRLRANVTEERQELAT